MRQKNKEMNILVCCLLLLGASLQGNLLSVRGIIRAGDGVITAEQDF